MFLYSKLKDYNKTIHIAFIGCGKFVSMFLAQLNNLVKIEVDIIIDLDIKRAKYNCINSGLKKTTFEKINFSKNVNDILENNNIDIVIEATGNAKVGILNAIKIINSKKNIIMVNVEADVVSGKYLSDLAQKNGVIYSMAYGDQPALILEQIEWATVNGFEVTCAGKGTKYHPSFEYSTPETVWDNYGISAEKAKKSGMNKKMFNSFLTGDKSSIEMAAVVNASNLLPPENGLSYPSLDTLDLVNKLIPKKFGGLLNFDGQVEVVSSIDKYKAELNNHIRWGVFIVFKGKSKYIKNCFEDYGMIVNSSGDYTAIWRPYHYIGLELAQSIYSIALNMQATGKTLYYKADVAAVAKVNLKPGDILDGEGGFKVKGKLISAKLSKEKNILPLGLSDNVKVRKNINKNQVISMEDINSDFKKEIIYSREYQFKLLD